MRRGVGDGPSAVPHGCEVWGEWGQRGGRAAWRHRQQPGRNAHGWHVTSAETGEGGGSPGRRRFEYISNSNEFNYFKTFQTLTDP
jgi:hypothetical protein